MTTTSTPIICSFKSKSGETGDDPLPYNDILMGDTNIDGLDGCEFPSATGGDPSPVNLNDQYNTILPDGYTNENTVGQERPRGLAHATTKLEGQYPEYTTSVRVFYSKPCFMSTGGRRALDRCAIGAALFRWTPLRYTCGEAQVKFRVIGNFCSLNVHPRTISTTQEARWVRKECLHQRVMLLGEGANKVTLHRLGVCSRHLVET
jgi:hypothetical protein